MVTMDDRVTDHRDRLSIFAPAAEKQVTTREEPPQEQPLPVVQPDKAVCICEGRARADQTRPYVPQNPQSD